MKMEKFVAVRHRKPKSFPNLIEAPSESVSVRVYLLERITMFNVIEGKSSLNVRGRQNCLKNRNSSNPFMFQIH